MSSSELSTFVAYSMAGIKAADPSKTLVEQRSPFFSIYSLSKEGGISNDFLAGPGMPDDGTSGRCFRQYQPNPDAYSALHACMAGLMVALDSLELVPGTGAGGGDSREAGNDRVFFPLFA